MRGHVSVTGAAAKGESNAVKRTGGAKLRASAPRGPIDDPVTCGIAINFPLVPGNFSATANRIQALSHEARPSQDSHNNTIGFLAASLISLLAGVVIGGFMAPPVLYISPALNTGSLEKPWLDEYQTLVTGIITSAIALGAAFVAWHAVQIQISAQRSISEAKYNESKHFIISSLDDYLRTINLVWRELEGEPSNDEIGRRNLFITRQISKVRACGLSIEEQFKKALPRIEYAKDALCISDRFKVDELINFSTKSNNQIRSFLENEYTTEDYEIDNPDNPLKLEKLRLIIQFSHLRMACNELDASLSEIFTDRIKYPVNWDPMWRHLETFANTYPNSP